MSVMIQNDTVSLAIQSGSVESFTSGGLRRDFSFSGYQLTEFAEHIKRKALLEHAELACGVLAEEITRVCAENEALRREMLTPEVFQRIVEWLQQDPIRPASSAFTANLERQIAYALEMDVVPMLKQARLRTRHERQGAFDGN